MSLLSEYKKQFEWRDWQHALSLCPIEPGQRVVDLGCGPGDVSALLASRGASVTGVDHNASLLGAARECHATCTFEQQDLRDLSLPAGGFDGLWCSFAAAYFADFDELFQRWCAVLKPCAWVCLVEIDGLLDHDPLSEPTHRTLQRFYDAARAQRRYDFRAGARLAAAAERAGFAVRSTTLADRELSFEGAATPAVQEAWRLRLERMTYLRDFWGAGFAAFESEFLGCLANPGHRSHCQVRCCTGVRKR